MPPRDYREFEDFSASAKRVNAIQKRRGDQARIFDSGKVLPDWMPEAVDRIGAKVNRR